jgi:hypothetical protein
MDFLQVSLKKIVVAPNMPTVPFMKALVTVAQGKEDSPVEQKKEN